MPRKKSDTVGGKASGPGTDPVAQAIAAAMTLAAEKPWRDISLYEIALAVGQNPVELALEIPSKSALLAAMARRADRRMLATIDEDWAEETVRDRLFAMLMARFDYLRPHRDGLKSALNSLRNDPITSLCLAIGPGQRSLDTALEMAGLSATGLRGALRRKGLGIAYAMAFRTFMKDDTDDLSQTMATLDKQLKNIESWAKRFENGPFRRRNRPDADDMANPATDGATPDPAAG